MTRPRHACWHWFAVLAWSATFLSSAQADSLAEVQSYEVKFFLKPAKVLLPNHELQPEVLQAFGLPNTKIAMAMQFLDSRPPQLHPAGWDVRLRKLASRKGLQLTFKRRFPVKTTVRDGLMLAAQEGFNADEKDYEVELEWGQAHRTLTFSRTKVLASAEFLQLHQDKASRTSAVNDIPGKLDRLMKPGWAKDLLAHAHHYGPVRGTRWPGQRDDIDQEIDLEVWLIPTADRMGIEPIVEISFKKKHAQEAEAKREVLRRLLTQKHWLLDEERLKTDLVLERFR